MSTLRRKTLSSEELRKMDAYWHASNYLSVGQIYLYKNPLLREPLRVEHIKPRLLGHWGTTPDVCARWTRFFSSQWRNAVWTRLF